MPATTSQPRKRSGSNKRIRQLLLGTRLTDEEMAVVQAAAARQNMSLSSYVRESVLEASAA